jgi:hypothetical protein
MSGKTISVDVPEGFEFVREHLGSHSPLTSASCCDSTAIAIIPLACDCFAKVFLFKSNLGQSPIA